MTENHQSYSSVWLIYYKSKSLSPTLTWSDAVEEALCFGWIDSTRKKLDDERFLQLFTKRKPKSTWSKINKEKVQQLINDGLMSDAGMASISIAKENGFWSILDDVEALIIPDDLEAVFEKEKDVHEYFLNLSKSNRKIHLLQLKLAKRTETRLKRIDGIIALSRKNK